MSTKIRFQSDDISAAYYGTVETIQGEDGCIQSSFLLSPFSLILGRECLYDVARVNS